MFTQGPLRTVHMQQNHVQTGDSSSAHTLLGKKMWVIALSPAAWRAQASLTILWSTAGSNAKLSFSWALGGCLEPQQQPGSCMEVGYIVSKSTNTLRSLLLLFHYQWKDKLSFHLTAQLGLFVTKLISASLLLEVEPCPFQGGFLHWARSQLSSTHGSLPAFYLQPVIMGGLK